MAELLFFMTDGDSGEFADYVFGQFDARFAMDESPTADLISVTRKDTFLSAIERSHFGARFSVLSDRWQKYPLAVSETITNDGRRFFCADQRHGGPAFRFHRAPPHQRRAHGPSCLWIVLPFSLVHLR